MTIHIHAGSWALRYLGAKETELTLTDGAHVSDALEQLKLPEDLTGMTAVNKTVVGRDHILYDGDTLQILPPIIGG